MASKFGGDFKAKIELISININNMFKNVYIILLSFLPFAAILGNEVDYFNFYALIVYINILMGVGLWGLWFNKSAVHISRLEVCMLLICAISFVSSLVNGYAICNFIYYGMLSSIILVTISKNYIHERETLFNTMIACVIILINILILGVTAFDSNNMIEHVGNSGISAIFIAVSACTILKIASETQNHIIWVRSVSCFLLIADLYYIYIYESRTAFIIIAVFLLIGDVFKSRYVRWSLFLLIVIVFAIAIIGNESKSQSLWGRLFILKNCLSLFSDSPLIGNGGIGSFCVKYSMKQAQYFATHTEMDEYYMVADNVMLACNEYIQLLCETGLVGVGVFLYFIFYILKYSTDVYIRKSILFSILVSAFFYYIFHTALFCALGIICIMLASVHSPTLFKIELSNLNTLIVGIVVSTGIIYSANHLRIGKKIRTTIDRRSLTDMQKEHIISNFGENKIFLASVAILDNSDEINFRIKDLISHSDILFLEGQRLRRKKRFKLAEERLLQASYICPNRFRYKFELYKTYKDTNDMNKAYKMAEHIIRMPVKIPSPTVLAIKKEVRTFLEERNER